MHSNNNTIDGILWETTFSPVGLMWNFYALSPNIYKLEVIWVYLYGFIAISSRKTQLITRVSSAGD